MVQKIVGEREYLPLWYNLFMKRERLSMHGWGGAGLAILALLILIPLGLRLVSDTTTGGTNSSASTPTLPETVPTMPEASSVPSASPPSGKPTLLWIESNAEFSQSTLYSAFPDRLDEKQTLAEFEHREGYPPTGSVSPDGTRVAILNSPSDASELGVRSNGNEVWVLNSDGSGLRKLPGYTSRLAGWAPDNSALALSSLDPLDPSDPATAFLTGISITTPDSTQSPIRIMTEDNQSALRLLGWGQSSDQLIVARILPDGKWVLVEWGIQAGKAIREVEVPGQAQVLSAAVEPAGEQILLSVVENDLAQLMIFDMDSGTTQELASGKMDGKDISPLTGLWSGDGQALLVHQLDQGKGEARQTTISASENLNQVDAMATAGSAAPYRPLALSADGQWVAYRDYTAADLPVYLQQPGSSQLITLPRSQPDHFIDVIGWISR